MLCCRIDFQRANRHFDDSWKQTPVDNCYFIKYYRWPVYTIQEAIQCHRESHHPSMLNEPSAPLVVDIELNMVAEKSTKFLDNFSRMARVPHKYKHGEERRILVFSKGEVGSRIRCVLSPVSPVSVSLAMTVGRVGFRSRGRSHFSWQRGTH